MLYPELLSCTYVCIDDKTIWRIKVCRSPSTILLSYVRSGFSDIFTRKPFPDNRRISFGRRTRAAVFAPAIVSYRWPSKRDLHFKPYPPPWWTGTWVEDMMSHEGTECDTRLAYPREPFCNFLSRANECALFVIVVSAGGSEEIFYSIYEIISCPFAVCRLLDIDRCT